MHVCAKEKESLMQSEAVLCTSGFASVSIPSIRRKAVPGFQIRQAQSVYHGPESSYCVKGAPVEHQESQAPSAEYFDMSGGGSLSSYVDI